MRPIGTVAAIASLLGMLGGMMALAQSGAGGASLREAFQQEKSQDKPRFIARQLIKRARQIARDGDLEGAKRLAIQAIRTAPDYAPAYTFMGHVHEEAGHKPQAISYFIEAMKLDARGPQGRYAQQRLAFLFHEGHFPRRLRLDQLSYAPTQFLVTQCRLPGAAKPGGEAPTRTFAYTLSTLFTDPSPLVIEVPDVPPDTPKYLRSFNREVCGFVEVPGEGDLALKFLVRFPSANLSRPDEREQPRDDTVLAQRVTALLLRLYWYAKTYLNLEPKYPEIKAWLCETGLAGGEWKDDNLYLYDKPEARAPIEWIREVCHEYGHLVLPVIGGFERPEQWANGELGERLFIKWLVEEAEHKVGERLPGPLAQQALDARWGNEFVDAESYLNNRYRRTLKFWFDRGPDSDLLVGKDEAAMEYHLGFALYIEAAHGLPTLKAVFAGCQGHAAPDFVASYRRLATRAALEGQYEVRASCYAPAAGKLPAWPTSGPMVTLSDRPEWRYLLYLPEGRWRLEAVGDAGSDLLVKVNDEPAGTVRTGASAQAAGVPIEVEVGGWVRVDLQVQQAPADARLEVLHVHPAPRET